MPKSRPKNWRDVKLKEFGKIVTGKTPPTQKKEYFALKFPFITPSDITSYDVKNNYRTERYLSSEWDKIASAYKIPKNSICFVCIGSTIGKMCYVKEPSFTNQQINSIIIDSSKADPDFVYYLLKANQNNIIKKYGGGGAAKEIINKSTFESIELHAIQDLPSQRRIASILSAFDDKIELNNKINQTLEQMAQAIFKEWFVDFRFPGHENVRMINSELGKIPEGWEVVSFGDVFHVYGGGTPKTTEKYYWLNGDIYWATPSDFTKLNTHLIDDTERKITKIGLENSAATIMPIGSVLMTSRATIGCLAINKVPMATNQGFISLVPKCYLSSIYLLHELIYRVNEIKSFAFGSTFPEISRSFMRNMKLLLPSKETVLNFSELAENKYRHIYNNMRTNRKLSSLRDSLLPKLMSGEMETKKYAD